MRKFRFRALVTMDAQGQSDPGRQYQSGTRSLMVHAWSVDLPSFDKYFPAAISWEQDQPLHVGDRTIVTITVIDDDAPRFLAAGRPFTIWGDAVGHGVISRRVFTESGPS